MEQLAARELSRPIATAMARLVSQFQRPQGEKARAKVEKDSAQKEKERAKEEDRWVSSAGELQPGDHRLDSRSSSPMTPGPNLDQRGR